MFGGKNPWFHGKNHGFMGKPMVSSCFLEIFLIFRVFFLRNRPSQPGNAWNVGAGAGTAGAAGQAAASASSGGRGREVPWLLGWINLCQGC